jgi:hypothetical protein
MSLYQNYEVEVSQSQLSKVLSTLGGPVCLLGGWAVYITVNKNFAASRGRSFMGSRDIDLGFHTDPTWTDVDLKESLFAKAINKIIDVGFEPVSFRFVKYFHTETRKELSTEEARRTAQAFVFNMYIDPLVDKVHPNSKKLFGFVPIDEPLLSEVFDGKKSVLVEEFGPKVMMPEPAVLLAMKLNSVSNRDKEHKRIKDMADIYGLVWHSDEEISAIRTKLFSMINREKVSSVISSFKDDEYASVARNLGVGQNEVSAAIAELRQET